MEERARPPRIPRTVNELQGRIPMFPRFIAILIATIAISQFEQTRGFTIPFFILAVAIVFVIEGVRVVPQQSAWVVERLGKFHAILQPGLNVIVPFVDRIAYTHSLRSEEHTSELQSLRHLVCR